MSDHNKIFDETEAKPIKDDKVHFSPWVETNRKDTIIGVNVGMSIEKFVSIIKKLKFW